MVRVFDSMEFEDELVDATMIGLQARGELDHQQTRQALNLDWFKEL